MDYVKKLREISDGSRPGKVAMIAVVLLMSLPAWGKVLTSGSFSLGYGYMPSGWCTDETAALNTATTLGDFSFTPSVNGGGMSTAGPTFLGRVLGEGPGSEYSGCAVNFSVSIAGSYNGPAPADAAVVPNYRLQLVIDSISIYGMSTADAYVNFRETTVEHNASGPEKNMYNGYGHLSWYISYVSNGWNPDDYAVAGTSVTRTFDLFSRNNALSDLALDGLEITGHLVLEYDVAPVPSAVLASGSFSLGYGYTSSGWCTDETAALNTATTLGDFSFTPSINSGGMSAGGPTFLGRVLGEGLGDEYSGYAGNFSVSVAGSYNGPAPADAAVVPNYRLKLVIDSISIYAMSTADAYVNFRETTVDRNASGPEMNMYNGYGHPTWGIAYVKNSWNPDDYTVAGTGVTRSFDLYSSNNMLTGLFSADQEHSIDGN